MYWYVYRIWCIVFVVVYPVSPVMVCQPCHPIKGMLYTAKATSWSAVKTNVLHACIICKVLQCHPKCCLQYTHLRSQQNKQLWAGFNLSLSPRGELKFQKECQG